MQLPRRQPCAVCGAPIGGPPDARAAPTSALYWNEKHRQVYCSAACSLAAHRRGYALAGDAGARSGRPAR